VKWTLAFHKETVSQWGTRRRIDGSEYQQRISAGRSSKLDRRQGTEDIQAIKSRAEIMKKKAEERENS